MKKILTILCASILCLSLFGCQQKTPFQEKSLTASQLQKKIDKKQSFIVIVERENCPYCEALNKYIKETKDEHPNLVLYKIDTTKYGFTKKDEDSKQLTSSTKEGKTFLNIVPYFYYTPTLYVIQKGKPKHAGIGYDEQTKSISLWDVDSPIDFDSADTQEFWEFLETYE